MSRYLEDETVKKTFLITSHQNRRLKSFCKLNRISASQLFRLFIDDLHMASYDTTRSSIESVGFRVQNFVGAYDREEPDKEYVNDGKGNKQARWFKKNKWFNGPFF